VADEPVTLPLSCTVCGQPVDLSYTPSDEPSEQSWTCPSPSCRRVHRLELKGQIERVVARDEPPKHDERRRHN
jgi:hypothetical protein